LRYAETFAPLKKSSRDKYELWVLQLCISQSQGVGGALEI